MNTPRLVVLESPYAGDVEANLEYARRALADSLARGEAPIASHLLYTQPGVLDDRDPDQRAQGIAAGLAWGRLAWTAVFYIDRGMSPGMAAALELYNAQGMGIEQRRLDPEPCNVLTCKLVDAFMDDLYLSEKRDAATEIGVDRRPFQADDPRDVERDRLFLAAVVKAGKVDALARYVAKCLARR